MNHHLSSDKLWWTESPSKGPVSPMLSQNALSNFSQNHQETARDGDDNNANKELREVIVAEREAMFEKPLTPSDVGKLNRLVIPKQHAERYFPIGGNSSGGTEAVEKGLLLSFEDELGKLWRFRYSYWNSSQSYVLTKGWSRYVKEKQLQAGDTVIFERFRDDGERFFIGWRRRNTVVVQAAGGWTPPLYSSGHPYPSQNSRPDGPPLPYQTHCLHAEIEEKISSRGGVDTERAEASAGVQNQTSSGNSRTLRLFGVDLKCQLEEPLADGPDQQGEPQYHPQSSSNATTSQDHVSHYQNHVDINFSGDRCKPE